jgi:signal transduction histidine kinase
MDSGSVLVVDDDVDIASNFLDIRTDMGHADIDGTIAALRHGASDYVVKPINADVIRSSLNRIARPKDAEERALQAERLAAIGQMAASIAHESRNFLQRIYAASEFLQELVADNTEALEEVERIQSAEKGLEHLLEEIREFAGPMKLERVGCSIESVWKRAWSEVSAAKNVCDVQFNEDVDDVDLSCHIDEFRIAQVFRNLFENSLAACDESPQIQVLCQNSGGTLKIAIRDNGPGLTTEQQQNVFQPFFTTKAKGTGLGMAIVERIVESHGGSIRVETGYADGAEFILTLPTGYD